MSRPHARVTTGKASLVGGIVVAIASMVLWLAVMHELGFHGTVMVGAGLLVAGAAGVWTRLADL
jgi:hypothetical protein